MSSTEPQGARAGEKRDYVAVDTPHELWPAVYDELHAIASRLLRASGVRGTILQTTGIVHDAYLRLQKQDWVKWNDRNHYLSVAALTIRRILTDWARAEKCKKRGGRVKPQRLEESSAIEVSDPTSLLDLDQALSRLADWSQLGARVVELRYFAGLSIKETAEVLRVSPRKVDKEWAFARSWLHRELSDKDPARM